MPATSADNSILATGRPVRIPTPDDPSGFPNYYRNFRLTTLDVHFVSPVPSCLGAACAFHQKGTVSRGAQAVRQSAPRAVKSHIACSAFVTRCIEAMLRASWAVSAIRPARAATLLPRALRSDNEPRHPG